MSTKAEIIAAQKARRRSNKESVAIMESTAPASVSVTNPPPAPITVRPPNIKETVTRLNEVRRFIIKALNVDLQKALAKAAREKKPLEKKERARLEVDYGTVPGQEDKRFLKQPGAEKIGLWLHVRPVYEKEVTELGNGHIEVASRCRLLATSDGSEVFQGPVASCTSMESNFRFRWVRMTPQPTREWSQTEGDIKKQLGTHKIVPEYKSGQKTGAWIWMERHDNPNIYDERNKVRQQAEKRALVKAIRNYGALSEIFTEDPSEWNLPAEEGDSQPEEEKPAGRIVTERDNQNAAEAASQVNDPTGSQDSEKGRRNTEVASTASKTLIVTFTDKDLARVTAEPIGTLAEVLPFIKDQCKGIWLDRAKVWQVLAFTLGDLQDHAAGLGFKYQEIQKSSGPPEPDTSRPGSKVGSPLLPTVGIVKAIKTDQKTTKGIQHMQVLWNGCWCHCYRAELWQYLAQTKDKECELIVELINGSGPLKITGIKRIGKRRFDDDGVTPVIDPDEMRGKGTEALFK